MIKLLFVQCGGYKHHKWFVITLIVKPVRHNICVWPKSILFGMDAALGIEIAAKGATVKKQYLDTRLDLSPLIARQVRSELAAILPRLNFDKKRLGQVQLAVSEWLENLRGHAQKPASWVHICLAAEKGNYVLSVKDNGSHFERFNEVLNSAENRIENESGRGLYLLREQFPQHRYCVTECGDNLLEIWLGKIEPERQSILLIDDDPVLSRLLACYLGDEYRVDSCCDAEAATQFLDRQHVDLILCDINMPGESGIAFRQCLLADSRWQDTPFIFISAADSAEVLAAANCLAVDDYLVKPVTKKALLRVVSRVLQRSCQLRRSLGQKVDQQISGPLAPTLPSTIGDVTCHLRNAVASPGGGDIVVWHRQPNRTLIVFADLMGHGAQAKYYAHALAGYLRGMLYASDADLKPGQMLARISAALCDDQLLNSTIATCMVMSIRTGGAIEMASGGHPPPLLWRNQQWSPVAISGGLPGLSPDQQYPTLGVKLHNHERLLVTSDGLWEQGDSMPARYANEEVMLDTLNQKAGEKGQVFIENVWDRFMQLTNQQPSDDVTLAIFERNPD